MEQTKQPIGEMVFGRFLFAFMAYVAGTWAKLSSAERVRYMKFIYHDPAVEPGQDQLRDFRILICSSSPELVRRFCGFANTDEVQFANDSLDVNVVRRFWYYTFRYTRPSGLVSITSFEQQMIDWPGPLMENNVLPYIRDDCFPERRTAWLVLIGDVPGGRMVLDLFDVFRRSNDPRKPKTFCVLGQAICDMYDETVNDPWES